MKSMTMKPCMISRFTTRSPGTPRGPCADGTPSYCEMAPQHAMRPRLFISDRQASSISPPNVIEIDVDAARRGGAKCLEYRAVRVIDRGVKAEFGGEPIAFFLAAGDADDATALYLRDLTNQRADRSGGGRDDDSLAGLGFADVEQSEIGGEPGDAIDAQKMRHRLDLWQLAQMFSRPCGVLLPAGVAEHEIAGSQPRRF